MNYDNPKVNEIMGLPTKEFEDLDYIDLALACLDQVKLEKEYEIVKSVRDSLNEYDLGDVFTGDLGDPTLDQIASRIIK